MSETTKITVLGTIRFARELPRPMRLLCIAEPIQPVAFADDATTALYDVVCGETAGALDLARGGFVCDRHITHDGWCLADGHGLSTLRHLVWHTKQATGNGTHYLGTEMWRANRTLRMIEERLYRLWRAENPRRHRAKRFPPYLEAAWERLSAMLTYQTRISTARNLLRSDN